MHTLIMQDSCDDYVDIKWLSNDMIVNIPENRRIISRVASYVGGTVLYTTYYTVSYTTRYITKRLQDNAADYMYKYGTQYICTAITGYIIMSLKRTV